MLATRVRRTSRSDARVPRFTIWPQAAATLAMAGDHTAARVALVLAVGVNLPLHVAGRLDRRNPDLPSVRPLAAVVWACLCVAVFPQVLGASLHAAAVAAAWSSLAIAVLLYLVPGPWSRVGAGFRGRRTRDVPLREIVSHVSRRLVGVSLLGAIVAFLAAPGLSTVCALIALAALAVALCLKDSSPA